MKWFWEYCSSGSERQWSLRNKEGDPYNCPCYLPAEFSNHSLGRGKPCTYQEKWRWNWEFGEAKIATACSQNARGGYSFLKNSRILQRSTLECLAEYWSRMRVKPEQETLIEVTKDNPWSIYKAKNTFLSPPAEWKTLQVTWHCTIVQRVLLHLCNA